MNFSSWFGLDYAIVYFYNVYGGNEISDGQFATVIGKFKKLVSEGEKSLPVVEPGQQLRNFTHYSDIISGLVTVALKGSGDGFGIGSDRAVSMLDIVKFLKCTPHYVPARRGNRMSADLVTIATQKLGWRPKVDIEDHLAEFFKTGLKGYTENICVTVLLQAIKNYETLAGGIIGRTAFGLDNNARFQWRQIFSSNN